MFTGGIEMDSKYKSISDEELLNIIKKEFERIGSSEYRLYDKYRNRDLPASKYIVNRYNSTWNGLLELMNIELNVKRLGKEEFDKWFIDLVNELGEVPSRYFLQNNYSFYVYHMKKYYGNHTNLCKIIDHEIVNKKTVTHTDEELLQMYYELYLKLKVAPTKDDLRNNGFPYSGDVFYTRFGSLVEVRKLLNIPQKKAYVNRKSISKEEVKKELVTIYNEHGRISANKLNKLCNYSTNTILRKFKTTRMNDVWEEIEKDL